jgi:hypothetical protein
MQQQILDNWFSTPDQFSRYVVHPSGGAGVRAGGQPASARLRRQVGGDLDDPGGRHDRQCGDRLPREVSMSTIDSMQQNPGEWFPVSLEEVSSITLDFKRRGIPVDPDWSELLRTAKELGFKTQASLRDGRVYVHIIWPDGRTTIYENTLVGNVLTTQELR